MAITMAMEMACGTQSYKNNRKNNALVMEITILSGSNLIAKDKNFFTRKKLTSDAYAMLYFGSRYVGKTEVIPKTLNPNWNHTFELQISVSDLKQAERGCKDCANLTLHIFDKDILSTDDYMGEVTVPMPLDIAYRDEPFTKELAMEYFSECWYYVTTGDKTNKRYYCHNATGKIQVRVIALGNEEVDF